VSSFDRLDHSHILRQLGTFPARGMVKQWLKAGVVEHGRLTPTEEGVPQGGVISPVLLNIALHGMEHAVGVCYRMTGSHAGYTAAGSPVLVRYADLCGHPHKSAYAESLVMPSSWWELWWLLVLAAGSSA
jgi:RNA-directed DNA polymerase